jgi:hypothetical protein
MVQFPTMTMTALERAFQLARDGACASVGALVEQVSKEGYVNAHGHLAGTSIRKQLAQIIRDRRAPKDV